MGHMAVDVKAESSIDTLHTIRDDWLQNKSQKFINIHRDIITTKNKSTLGKEEEQAWLNSNKQILL